MRTIFISIFLGILLVSSVSAGMIIGQQPDSLYNIGEVVKVPVKITATETIEKFYSTQLICSGKQSEIQKEFIVLTTGQEKSIDSYIPLISSFITTPNIRCNVKVMLGEEYLVTNEFKVSGLLNVTIKNQDKEFAPKETLKIEGRAIRESGKSVNGFVDLILTNELTSEQTNITELVNEGTFLIQYALPENIRSGNYIVRINVYEKDSLGAITNRGYAEDAITITQIPKSLEIILEQKEITPGTDLKFRAILHDQAGDGINSTAILVLKDSNGKLREERKIDTEETTAIPIAGKELPSEWTLSAKSGDLTFETPFKILEKEDISVELINRTILVTNTGNIPYNKTVAVKISNETVYLDTFLDVGKDREYTLTAPEGEYHIVVETEGQERLSQSNVMLTGNVIAVKEASSILGTIKYPIVWTFMTFILGFIAVMFFRKGYQRSFFGYIKKRKEKKSASTSRGEVEPLKNPPKGDLLNIKNKAVLSLSIKGEKQKSTLVCLRIKNIDDVKRNRIIVTETLNSIASEVLRNKAVIYESQDSLFFIFAPVKTKTFKNEGVALALAEKIQLTLKDHNRKFKQKIEYGLAVNNGEIVAKLDKNSGDFTFMPMGSLTVDSKKLAGISSEEVLMARNVKEKLGNNVRAEKVNSKEVDAYKLTEFRDKEEYQKFISSFLKRNKE